MKRLLSLTPPDKQPCEQFQRANKRPPISPMLTRARAAGNTTANSNQPESGQAFTDQVLSMATIMTQLSCGMCNLAVNDDAIKCSSCNLAYHPSSQCTGLKPLSIQCLQEEENSAITYRCTSCRCQPVARGSADPGGDGEWRAAVGQVLEIVKSLATNMSQLSLNLNAVMQQQNRSSQNLDQPSESAQVPQGGEQTPLTRKDLYTEMFEFEERKKRVSSIIVRGIEADTVDEFSRKFTPVYQHLTNAVPQIASTHCISAENNMFRVTFKEKAARVEIMSLAKNLASSSDFRSVYISRDLTLAQRNEIKARRSQRPRPRGTHRGDSPGDPPGEQGTLRSPRSPASGSNAVPIQSDASSANRQSAASATTFQ